MLIADFFQRVSRTARIALEITILSALILAARCANYRDVFVAGNVYFTDADCYARMTRVLMCTEHPGLIIRHHQFENFPEGTTPHTTAPLDYLILGFALVLQPFSAHALDLAGALVSPFLALLCGWFLWWWSRRMRFRFRGAMLLLYAISPILVHGGKLGRPDHQSLLILLVAVGLCAEWLLQTVSSRKWSLVSGAAWGLALWVSFYEPLLFLSTIVACYGVAARNQFTARHRQIGLIAFAALIVLSFLIEQRIPQLPFSVDPALLKNWARSIGELMPVRMTDPIWFHWTGYFLLLIPLLIGGLLFFNRYRPPIFMLILFVLTYALTLWQARFAYFFVMILILILPVCLAVIKRDWVGWMMASVAFFPILQDWDEKLWPNELKITHDLQERVEAIQWRELATQLRSNETNAFLAPWWISPSISYWSGQPGVAGSSHESLAGTADSARFFLATDVSVARGILAKRGVVWVFVLDSENLVENSAAMLDLPIPANPLARVLARTPSHAPPFLSLAAQNGVGKFYHVTNAP